MPEYDGAVPETSPQTNELARKALHIGSAGLPLLYWLADRRTALAVTALLTAVSLAVEFARSHSTGFRSWLARAFGYLFRPEERFAFSGGTYVLLANLLAMLLFSKQIAIASLLILSLADAAASLIGRRVRSPAWNGKSLAGSSAFLATAGLIVWLVLPPPQHWAGWCGVLAATATEAMTWRLGPIRIDDNLLVPLVAGAVMTLLT